MSELTNIISSARPEIRNRSLDEFCAARVPRRPALRVPGPGSLPPSSDNLYERVRALFFLYAIHRFHVPLKPGARSTAPIPFAGYEYLLSAASRKPSKLLESQSAEGPAPPSPAPWPPPIVASAFRLWPTRSAAAFARCAAISGCSAPATPPITRCKFAGILERPHPPALSHPLRSHSRPHGSDP